MSPAFRLAWTLLDLKATMAVLDSADNEHDAETTASVREQVAADLLAVEARIARPRTLPLGPTLNRNKDGS